MKARKSLFIIALIAVFLISATSCRVFRPHYHHPSTVIIHSNPNGKIPPGQLKKVTGEKSAKKYAPGQNKKGKKKK